MPTIVGYQAEYQVEESYTVYTEYGQEFFGVDEEGNPIEEDEE